MPPGKVLMPIHYLQRIFSEITKQEDVEKISDRKCCKAPFNSCIHSRRCFMSGEYCSQLANIHKARKKLHAVNEIETSGNHGAETSRGREINLLVISNFTNMSDVAYKWQLRPFMESLKDYFYFIFIEGTLVFSECGSQPDSKPQRKGKIKKINVIHTNSNYDSNYVICNQVYM